MNRRKPRRDLLLLLWAVALGIYFLAVYRPLTHSVRALEKPTATLREKLSTTQGAARSDLPDFAAISNRVIRLRAASQNLERVALLVERQAQWPEPTASRLAEPFQLVDFLNARQRRVEDLSRIARDKKIPVTPPAPAALPDYSTALRQPELLWAQLAIADRLLAGALQGGAQSIKLNCLPLEQAGAAEPPLWHEIAVRIELLGPHDKVLNLIAAWIDTPPDAGGTPPNTAPLFLGNITLRKTSATDASQVAAELLISGFVKNSDVASRPREERQTTRPAHRAFSVSEAVVK